MSVDDNPGDDAPAPDAFADNVVPFRRERNSRAALPRYDESRDDDELLQLATNTITNLSRHRGSGEIMRRRPISDPT